MNIKMIEAARRRHAGRVLHTPLLSSPFLDEIAGRRVFVKAECLQHTGSFKYRGGLSAVSALALAGTCQGVIAYSSGNHAQGVALAARQYSLPAVIVMPSDAPAVKIENTRMLGAEVVLYDRATEDRDAIGGEISTARGLDLIKPFDDPEVIAGQGTTGLEVAEQAGEAGIEEADVLVCCGGGGLSSGIALALAERAPGLRVRPVEPEGFDDVARSLAAGEIRRNAANHGGFCDAILTPAPGELTFPILKEYCGPGLVVTDDEVRSAMGLLADRLHLVIEPGGAVAVAAALFHGHELRGSAVFAVATGGNVDRSTFIEAISEGAAAG